MTASETSDEELARFRAIAEAPIEDHRGVDIVQIRERLRLTPAERVARMVDEVRTFQALLSRMRHVDS